jgi:hypothetical protein
MLIREEYKAMPEGPSEECAAAPRRYERMFILRFWREADGAAASALRGSVIELESGRRFFFSGLRDLHDFLSLRLS